MPKVYVTRSADVHVIRQEQAAQRKAMGREVPDHQA